MVLFPEIYLMAFGLDGFQSNCSSSKYLVPVVNDGSVSEGFVGASGVVEHQENSANILGALPLPVDSDDWERMRKPGLSKIYVDKTYVLKFLIDYNCGLYLFTRPRRFGKTLLLQMIKSFFLANSTLFNGTMIYKRGNIVHKKFDGSWIEYPVIHLDFSKIKLGAIGDYVQKAARFETGLEKRLKKIADHYGVDTSEPNFDIDILIQDLKEKFNLKVIILIDEYDAPINRALYEYEDQDLAELISNVLNEFFSQIKASADCIQMAWVTGIMRLGIDAFMSGANSFTDVSYKKEMATAVGFTENEIITNFEWYVDSMEKRLKLASGKLMPKLIYNYDGYRFSLESEDRVFNPISILRSLENQRIGTYWSSTSSLNYIVKEFYEVHYTMSSFKLIDKSGDTLFRKRRVIEGNIPIVCFMFWNGYLKIDVYDPDKDMCTLTYANIETRDVINDALRNYAPNEKTMLEKVKWLPKSLRDAMTSANISQVVDILNRLGFPTYYVSLNENVDEKEVTRRLIAILRTADLCSRETEQFFSKNALGEITTEGDLDITTADLKVNYVIEVKCGKGRKAASALDGIKQLVGYATETERKRTAFLETLGDPSQMRLLSLHFQTDHGGRIDDWIFLPFSGNKLRTNEMQASDDSLITTFKTELSKMNIDSKYIDLDNNDEGLSNGTLPVDQ